MSGGAGSGRGTPAYPPAAPRQLIHAGERMQAGSAAYCGRLVAGRVCHALLGAPAEGALVVTVQPPGATVRSMPDYWAFVCAGCRAVYVFAVGRV